MRCATNEALHTIHFISRKFKCVCTVCMQSFILWTNVKCTNNVRIYTISTLYNIHISTLCYRAWALSIKHASIASFIRFNLKIVMVCASRCVRPSNPFKRCCKIIIFFLFCWLLSLLNVNGSVGGCPTPCIWIDLTHINYAFIYQCHGCVCVCVCHMQNMHDSSHARYPSEWMKLMGKKSAPIRLDSGM